ncbi:MAG: hypothetical protein ACKO96_09795, partial [Flammeovirgaceae bacterium]
AVKATSKIDDAVKSLMKRYENIDEVWPGCDCSEIAEDIYKRAGGGNIMELRAEKGIKLRQSGEVDKFDYHQIYVKDGYVYDPRYSSDPVLYDDFMKDVNSTNKNVKITDVTPKD